LGCEFWFSTWHCWAAGSSVSLWGVHESRSSLLVVGGVRWVIVTHESEQVLAGAEELPHLHDAAVDELNRQCVGGWFGWCEREDRTMAALPLRCSCPGDSVLGFTGFGCWQKSPLVRAWPRFRSAPLRVRFFTQSQDCRVSVSTRSITFNLFGFFYSLQERFKLAESTVMGWELELWKLVCFTNQQHLPV
jgi:hypothetical protein